MLILPKPHPDLACICGIDPGTTFMGLSAIFFNVKTLAIEHSTTTLLRGNNLIEDDEYALIHGDRAARVSGMNEELRRLFLTLTPIAIAAENNFMNIRRPQAYGALVESVNGIRFAANAYNELMAIDIVVPSQAKNAVGAKGGAGKEEVNAALCRLAPFINYYGLNTLESLVEHESDSLAIGFWRYRQLHEQNSDMYKRYPQLRNDLVCLPSYLLS